MTAAHVGPSDAEVLRVTRSGNRRADRILDAAEANGWVIERSVLRYSSGAEECWTVRPEFDPNGDRITLYPGSHHSVEVVADIAGYSWDPITQRDALVYIAEHPGRRADR